MPIFKRKALFDLRDALDGAITDGENYVESTFAEEDYADHPSDLKNYRKKVNRWRKLFSTLGEWCADPVDDDVFVVFEEYHYHESDPTDIWGDSFSSIQAAKAAVLAACVSRREEEEIGIAIELLPTFQYTASMHSIFLFDSATDYTWTIRRTALKTAV